MAVLEISKLGAPALYPRFFGSLPLADRTGQVISLPHQARSYEAYALKWMFWMFVICPSFSSYCRMPIAKRFFEGAIVFTETTIGVPSPQ